MSLTLDVSHLPISWLNSEANPNISAMLVTRDVSQADMLLLNPDVLKNNLLMLVTWDVHHSSIFPYVIKGSPQSELVEQPLIM